MNLEILILLYYVYAQKHAREPLYWNFQVVIAGLVQSTRAKNTLF